MFPNMVDSKMYEKNKRKLIMQRNLDDAAYQRRKTCWLSYGRAILTIAILGLLTVSLYAWSQSHPSNEAEHNSRVIAVNDATVESDEVSTKILSRTKRSVDLRPNDSENGNSIEKPKNSDESEDRSVQSLNDINSEQAPKMDSQHLKLFRRQQNSGLEIQHRHSDGDVYYLTGYKCVPVRKPSKHLELIRARQRLNLPRRVSGMLCCL